VSKRTVYNHFGDKESLFLAVVQQTFGRMIGLTDEILRRHLGDLRDQSAVEPVLIAALLEVARTITVLPERAALIRLIIAEASRFPMLVQPWRDRGTVTDIISAQLSQLADRGLLTFDDPVQATQHLSALTLSQLNTRSLFGTLPLNDAEIEQVIRSGVHVYLLAYGPRR
jgi:TetR/AcrR family transcriptional repressor of mexJK operon